MLEQCKACTGTKRVTTLGMVFNDCNVCQGKGYVVVAVTKEPEPAWDNMPAVVEAKIAASNVKIDKRSKAYRLARQQALQQQAIQ